MKNVAKNSLLAAVWFLIAGVWFISWVLADDGGANVWMFVFACALFTIGCSFVAIGKRR